MSDWRIKSAMSMGAGMVRFDCESDFFGQATVYYDLGFAYMESSAQTPEARLSSRCWLATEIAKEAV